MSRRRLSILFLNVGHTYDHFFMLIFPTAVLALHREWQVSYGEALALGTFGFAAFAAGTMPAGWLGDRWSRTGMMTLFFLGIGAASVLTGLARSPVEIAWGLGLIGLFASIYHPVGTAMVVEAARSMGGALGVNGVFGNMGIALAALVTGALVDLYGWRWAFIAPGLAAILTGLLFAAFARFDSAAGAAAGKARPAAGIGRREQVRVFAVVAITSLFGGLVFHALTVALPKLFEQRLEGLVGGTAGIGVAVSVVVAVAAMGQIVSGYLIDRVPAKWVLSAIALLQVPLLLLAVPAAGAAVVAVMLPALFVNFGQITVVDGLVGRYTGEAWRARVYSVKYLLSLGVSAGVVPFVAVLHDATGRFDALLAVLAGCSLVVGLASLVFLPLARPAAATPQPAE